MIDDLVFGNLEQELLQTFSDKLLEAAEEKTPLEPPFAEYKDDPVNFAHNVLEIPHLTERQVEILESIRDYREVNVMAAHGVGKTFIAAVAVVWWVFAVGGLCPTTAPSQRMVNDLLWRYIRKIYDTHKGVLGGDRTQMRMWLRRDVAEAWGFTASPHSEEGFSGIHDPNLFAVQDEASGVADTVDAGFRSCLSGATNKGLRIGNPLAPGTPFHRACEVQSGRTIRITAIDHPNTEWAYDPQTFKLKPEVAREIKDERGLIKDRKDWPDHLPKEDKFQGAVSVEWIEDTRRTYGENSSYWIARVTAQFPDESPQALVPRSWFEDARRRYDSDPEYWDKKANGKTWVHGLDVGDGIDDHSLASMRGPVLYSLWIAHTVGDREDTTRAAHFMTSTLREKPGRGVVDRLGVGAGTLARLKEQGQTVRGVAFGGRQEVPEKWSDMFGSMRAYLFYQKVRREAFELGQIAIAPLGDIETRLKDELATIQYTQNARGQIEIEKKDKIKERLGRSPDAADSLALCFAGPTAVKVSKMTIESGSTGSRWR